MLIDRTVVEKALKRLNEAENRRPRASIEETIAGIDAVMAADVEGWKNGVHAPNREAERQGERILLDVVTDYHRDIERIVIDPPFGVFTWRITGTARGKSLEVLGCSVFEINDEGKIQHYWLYTDSGQLANIFS